LSPTRFAGTTQADRKPHAESYWENGDAEFTDAPGAESFDHLLGRADDMLTKLSGSNAQEILVYSHGQFIRSAAWLIKHGAQGRSCELMREFRAHDVKEPYRNCSSCQLVSTTADGLSNAKSPRLAKRDLSTISVQDSVLRATVSARHRSPILVSRSIFANTPESFGVT
jgi:hypothetical protein